MPDPPLLYPPLSRCLHSSSGRRVRLLHCQYLHFHCLFPDKREICTRSRSPASPLPARLLKDHISGNRSCSHTPNLPATTSLTVRFLPALPCSGRAVPGSIPLRHSYNIF